MFNRQLVLDTHYKFVEMSLHQICYFVGCYQATLKERWTHSIIRDECSLNEFHTINRAFLELETETNNMNDRALFEIDKVYSKIRSISHRIKRLGIKLGV